MHPISDKELDKLFQQRFGELEIEPPAAIWEKITVTMDQNGKRKTAFPAFWMAAASIIILISAGLWFFRPVEVIKLHGSSEMAQTIEDTTPLPEVNESLPAIEEPLSNTAETVNPELSDFGRANAVRIESNESRPTEKAPPAEPETKLPEVKEPVAIASVPVKKLSQTLPNKEVKVPERYSGDQSSLDVTQPDMMAKVDFQTNEMNPDGHEIRGQRKIRSIGSLVNFVIARVDKREDKLIEFKDSDEGSEVSGINLGLVKIKSRK